MAVKTFSVGETLTASDTNTYLANAGLVYITGVTVGSGVSTVTISNCLSATYDMYEVIYRNIAFSASATNFYLQFGGVTAGYYSSLMYQLATSATVSTYNYSPQSKWIVAFTGTASCSGKITIANGNSGARTGSSAFASYDGSSSYGGTAALWCTTGTASTDLSFSMATGTMTGGSIIVYGYRKA